MISFFLSVRLLTLGAADGSLIYQENDERYTLALEKTSSRAFILINIGSSLTSEVRYVSTDRPYEPFQTVLPRVQEVEYDLTHHGDSFYIRTNDHAKTFRVVRAPVNDASRPNWQDFLPRRDRITVESVHAFRDHLVIEERDRGLSQIRIHHFPTGEQHTIEFPEPVYSAGLGPNAEFDTHFLRFHYASLVTAPCVFDYDMQTRRRELKKQQEVLGGYDPAQYQQERIFARQWLCVGHQGDLPSGLVIYFLYGRKFSKLSLANNVREFATAKPRAPSSD